MRGFCQHFQLIFLYLFYGKGYVIATLDECDVYEIDFHWEAF